MKKIYLLITAGAFLGAAIYILLPSKSSFTSQSILEADDFYSQSIQPIFDAKCIACHSCYNSPCQLKLTSFYSTQRGANKISIYDFPKLEAREPTRMFVDAKDINGWRKKGFYSITDKADQSILNHMVSNLNGIESGLQSNYQSEQSRVCIDSTSQDNINMYINENPAGRMPYGLPALEKKEIDLISTWQNLGSPGPQIKKQERKILEHEDVKDNVKKWESFFNRSSLKARLSSRYIYEHLFLANIYFDESFKVNFRLVRSRTRSGAIDEIATDYPFDDPGANFYYRLRPVLETIVHKSHIPFKFTDEKMKKWNKSFYISQWEWHPKSMPAYGRAGANPYKTFAAIPVKARYQFFLDESSYHIMTFIKGPVCRGQTALNVINDHFWVFFLDPSKDPLVNSKELYNKVSNKMSLPAELKDDFAPLVNLRKNYWRSIKDKYEYLAQKNLGLDWLWSGDKSDLDASITVMRHFDSAQVMQGLQGKTPKTAWVLDYQVFESIYYNLSAGYNVFGPLLHQVNSRLFMEISRVSSEDLFLTFLPQESRVDLRDKWNVPTPKEKESPLKWVVDLFTDDAQEEMKYNYVYHGMKVSTDIKLSTKDAKENFLKLIQQKLLSKEQLVAKRSALTKELKRLSNIKSSGVAHLPDTIIFSYEDKIYTLVHNKDHFNVSMLFFEDIRRNSAKDYIDIIPGIVSSYPNLFMTLDKESLEQLSSKLSQSKSASDVWSILKTHGLSRSSKDFWKKYKYFSDNNYEDSTNEYGYLDLNRYLNI